MRYRSLLVGVAALAVAIAVVQARGSNRQTPVVAAVQKVAPAVVNVYTEKIVEQQDPRGRSHYWIGAGEPRWETLEGTDMAAVHDGFVAVTPVHLDLTNHRALTQMTDWASALSAQLPRPRDRTS